MIDSVNAEVEKLEDLVGVASYAACLSFSRRLAFLNFANFARRVVVPLGQYPYRLLLLAKAKPNVACDERKAVCREILPADDSLLHINPLKVKVLFRRQLEEGARDGTIGVSLWVPIRLVCLKFNGSSQEMEAVSKFIKNACKHHFAHVRCKDPSRNNETSSKNCTINLWRCFNARVVRA